MGDLDAVEEDVKKMLQEANRIEEDVKRLEKDLLAKKSAADGEDEDEEATSQRVRVLGEQVTQAQIKCDDLPVSSAISRRVFFAPNTIL